MLVGRISCHINIFLRSLAIEKSPQHRFYQMRLHDANEILVEGSCGVLELLLVFLFFNLKSCFVVDLQLFQLTAESGNLILKDRNT